MVPKLLKSILGALVGERRLRALRYRLKGVQSTFSEAELIHDYFDSRPGPGVMVDVGAHFGESYRPYLSEGWKIYAFEPDSKNRSRLLKTPGADKVRLFPIAVSDHEAEEIAFFASEESDGISSLSAFRPTHRETERVRMTTLRRVLDQETVEHVDFLKIDTEGHDLFVLKGFPWERLQPEVILCEFEDSKTIPLGYDYNVLGTFLLNRGYTVFLSEWAPIVRYGVTHTWRTWRAYPCQLTDSNGWGNFVAFRPGAKMREIERYLRRFTAQSPPCE